MGDLETLKAVAGFGFLAYYVQNTIDQLSTFGVVTFGPVVTGTGLAENEVVWAEKLTEWTGTDGVHGSWFQVHQDGTWNVTSTSCFVVVNVDAFQLQIGVTMVGTGWVYTVFVGDNFPDYMDPRAILAMALGKAIRENSLDSGGGLTNNYLCWCCWCCSCRLGQG